MKLKLSSYNTLIVFVMATSAQSNTIIKVKPKFRIFFVRFNMVSYKVIAGFTNLAHLISLYNIVPPINIRFSITPSSVRLGSRIVVPETRNTKSRGVRYIGTSFTAIKSFADEVRVNIELLFASFTVLVFTLFGHQSEYNKLTGVYQ